MQTRLDVVLALALGALSTALYALAPLALAHHWDALMTASALARPEAVGTREVFFFAHPLVIPLTAPFTRLAGDPLAATSLREALFGGLVVAMAYAATRALSGSRASCVLAALALVLAQGRWLLASGGEEKEIALAFGGAFALLYLDYRELIYLALPARWYAASPRTRALLLGALLAVGCAVHLVNGLLVLLVLVDVALARGARRNVWSKAAPLLCSAVLLGAPFFVWLAAGPGGARTPFALVAHFLEYHLSGEFVSLPSSPAERFVQAYLGARAYLLGPRASPAPALEALAVAALASFACVRALRIAPAAAARLLAWVALLTLHFYFYQPWDPEAWAPAALAWTALLACGVLGPGRARGARHVAAALALGGLAAIDARALMEARRAVAPLARYAPQGRAPSRTPLADLVRWADVHMERDAIVVVSDRLLASYFHVFTRRNPVVRDYLDASSTQLRERAALTTLSLCFYAPRITSADLFMAAEQGQPIYLLTLDPEDRLRDQTVFGWMGLRFGRWDPREHGRGDPASHSSKSAALRRLNCSTSARARAATSSIPCSPMPSSTHVFPPTDPVKVPRPRRTRPGMSASGLAQREPSTGSSAGSRTTRPEPRSTPATTRSSRARTARESDASAPMVRRENAGGTRGAKAARAAKGAQSGSARSL